MRRFQVEFQGTAVIDLADAVITTVDDDWRGQFYNLQTEDEIVEHIAYNLIINHAQLSQLDGWANQPDAHAVILEEPEWDMYISAKE